MPHNVQWDAINGIVIYFVNRPVNTHFFSVAVATREKKVDLPDVTNII